MPERLIINHVGVIAHNKILEDYSVVCENGRIIDLLSSNSPVKSTGKTAGKQEQVIDANGGYLVPGFIDLHIHGLLEKLVDNGPDDLSAICRELPRFGVTGFLPSITPKTNTPNTNTPNANECVNLANLAQTAARGAEILGFFLEGHFLKLTGAIRGMTNDYSPDRVENLKKAAGDKTCVFGVSPEIQDILSLLPLMTENSHKQIPAFITHTMADYEQTINAIKAGAKHATHFYDVFPYPGEQEPGVRGCSAVEAVMASPEVSVDFILDGEHVHPGVVKMALACKGPEMVCLITDANLSAGMEPGVYKGIGGTAVTMEYKGGPAREFHGEGKKPGGLTGSSLTMDLAFKNAVKILGLSLPEATALVSANPARVLNLEHERGRIEKDFRADFSIMDKDLNIVSCYTGGKCVYTVS